VKEILTNKKGDPNQPIYLFLTGGAGTGKTFTAKTIFHSLMWMYNNILEYNPMQVRGIITTYTWKTSFNANGVTLHSTFHMPFNKSKYIPLKSEKLDTLTKHC